MDSQGKQHGKRPTKIEEMTKEQIRQAIIKKRECNAKAQSIVESLLENEIQTDYFLKCLCDINQTHFEDVIEERSILNLCGYPTCRRFLSQKDIPKQKYRISVKTNKVYDITARKSFCSNVCYKSAIHVKKQMLTSPLWFREYEKIPEFHLLPLESVGSMGQEVDLGITEKIVLKTEDKAFTSINDFTDASLKEIDKYQNSDNNNSNIHVQLSNQGNVNDACSLKRDIKHTDTKENTITKSVKTDISDYKSTPGAIENHQQSSNIYSEEINIKKSTQKLTNNPLNIVGDVVEKPVKPLDPILSKTPEPFTTKAEFKDTTINKKAPQKKQPSITAITIEVEKCLAEWFTIDTLLYLFGEEKVKEMVADKGECIQEYLNNYSKHIAYNSNTYDQYQALCRKLNMLELGDRQFDSQILTKETKPLPDYSILKEESVKMQLKVKAFFTGETEIPIQNDSIEVQCDQQNEEENEFPTTQLPLVDKNAQNALRRRIVCKHLNKVLPDLLRSLGLLTLAVSFDIRSLVNTFKLNANNIMFKPIQWTLIALVFIKLLSLRDSRLECLLEEPMAFQHMQLLLLSYKQDGGYMDRLITWLTDIDRLLDVSGTQLTLK